MSPPLRTAEDRAALRRAVKEGVIDILVTDHAPHAAHEKEGTLDEAPCGFTGLDLALSLTWELVRAGVLAEADLQRLWCRRPAEIFHLPWNGFAPGDPADFFLLDPEAVWVPGREDHVLQKSEHALSGARTARARCPPLAGRQAAVLIPAAAAVRAYLGEKMQKLLRDAGLFREQCLINGQWCGADDGKVLRVTNPVDNSLLGQAPGLRRCRNPPGH